ncbi:MAG: 50S ribosomal protein L4 [Parcubacteria group bacterium]|nr:50S ribosomal protein L4 [Parcubacteria group bacterium]
MNKVNIYNLAGEVVGNKDLNPGVFGVDIKPVVVQQTLVAQAANRRQPWAHTKTRAEVRGGGKKPWAQKGTGRSRHGSSRTPIWKGGGAAFGPRNLRNYTVRINKKMKQTALRMVLTDKLADQRLILVDTLALPEIKTKAVATALRKLPLKGRTVMFVLDKESKHMGRSSRNIPAVKTLGVESLNVYDLLNAQTIVLPVGALPMLEQLYGPKKV